MNLLPMLNMTLLKNLLILTIGLIIMVRTIGIIGKFSFKKKIKPFGKQR